jgi:hypothetical protein
MAGAKDGFALRGTLVAANNRWGSGMPPNPGIADDGQAIWVVGTSMGRTAAPSNPPGSWNC